MIFDRWQAPDRDSPTAITFDASVNLPNQLDILLQMEGAGGTKDDEVVKVTGQTLSRPRRWHKIFERMGLMYQDLDGATALTDLGKRVKAAKAAGGKASHRQFASEAISVLRKYQLRNPADESDTGAFPADADLHPYWAIWKVAIALDGKLHWDELNRVVMWILRHADLESAIQKIQAARKVSGYDPEKNGSAELPLGPRAYDQQDAPEGKDADGQVRDQKTTPWFKRAGFGELLLTAPGHGGGGYWRVHPDVLDILRAETKRSPAPFKNFGNAQEWFTYFGKVEEPSMGSYKVQIDHDNEPLLNDLPDSDPIYQKVKGLLDAGSVGIVLSGPPGTSKSWYARRIAAKLTNGNAAEVAFIQFHPSFSYDDFVEGFVPQESDSGPARFAIQDKILLRLCARAQQSPDRLHVLVIDELNRGDPSKIFGELMTYLERDYREKKVSLAYSGRKISVPHNLLLLATMNPYDKSVVDLDDALERRLDRIALDPDVNILRVLLEGAGMKGELIGRVIGFFVTANKKSPHGIGHAFFQGMKSDADLERLWDHKLRFILEKMFRFEPETYRELTASFSAVCSPPAQEAASAVAPQAAGKPA